MWRTAAMSRTASPSRIALLDGHDWQGGTAGNPCVHEEVSQGFTIPGAIKILGGDHVKRPKVQEQACQVPEDEFVKCQRTSLSSARGQVRQVPEDKLSSVKSHDGSLPRCRRIYLLFSIVKKCAFHIFFLFVAGVSAGAF